MNVHRIWTLVENGKYYFGPHALVHGLEEGFEKEHCIGAILGGRVLEDYPAERRCLIVGRFYISSDVLCHMHIVCDYSDRNCVKIVTAYIPRPPTWITPWKRNHLRR